MSDITREVYTEAASRAVTLHERLGLWPVLGYYRVQETGRDAIAVADRTVPRDVKVGRSQLDTRSFDIRSDGRERRIRRRNIGEYYMPLKDHPDLFARFARLGDDGEIGREAWLAWLHEYGVLGVLPDRTGPYQRNGTTDSFSRFVQEALLANRTLKLFEAVTADQNAPDFETIRDLLPEVRGDEPDQVEIAALQTIRDTVEQKIHAECHDLLKLRDTGVWRKKNMSPFAREWGCNSLLGAMWLQFSWLVSMDGLRYCEMPGCNRHISPYARSDKTTCGARCRKRKSRKS
jgi:hypothetical protein